MARPEKYLILAAIFVLLATIGTLMNSHPASAAGSAPVTIVNPLPVPVSGTVAAAQSGAWNVGINGTPTVQLSGTASVNVTNSPSAPLFLVRLDEPGRIPYQSGNGTCNIGAVETSSCAATFPAVPSGHRLVIQHVSIELGFGGAGVPVPIVAAIGPSPLLTGTTISEFPVPVSNLGTEVLGVADQTVLVYLDAGQAPEVFMNAGTGTIFGFVALSGYMLDCTLAPCAAIAQ